MKKEFKIPSILGLLFLVLGTAASVFLLRQNSNQTTQASGSCDPGAIQVSNITDKSCDLSFVTSNSCQSVLSINNRLINDARASSVTDTLSAKTHYFQIDNLTPDTEYTYSLTNSGNIYTNASYKIKTAKKIQTSIPTSNLAWGKIYKNDLKPASLAIIYINIPGSSLLSSFVTSNGNWNISLANSLDENKSNWFTPVPNTDEDITVISDESQPVILTGNTSNNNPVPDIIIGQTISLDLPKLTPTIATIIATQPTTAPLLKKNNNY